MKLFKIVASKGGQVLFDDRIEATTPREARNQMRAVLGLNSLTGVVYSITEVPVELIREIAEASLAEALLHFEGEEATPSLLRIIQASVAKEVREQSMELRRELIAHPSSESEEPVQFSRFDPFSDEEDAPSAPCESDLPVPSEVVEQVRAIAEERRTSQSARRGRVYTTADGREIDWESVKKHYLGNRSIKQTAAHFDLSINTVKSRARKEGWSK